MSHIRASLNLEVEILVVLALWKFLFAGQYYKCLHQNVNVTCASPGLTSDIVDYLHLRVGSHLLIYF